VRHSSFRDVAAQTFVCVQPTSTRGRARGGGWGKGTRNPSGGAYKNPAVDRVNKPTHGTWMRGLMGDIKSNCGRQPTSHARARAEAHRGERKSLSAGDGALRRRHARVPLQRPPHHYLFSRRMPSTARRWHRPREPRAKTHTTTRHPCTHRRTHGGWVRTNQNCLCSAYTYSS